MFNCLRYDKIRWDKLDNGLPIEDFLTLTSLLLSKNYQI